MRRVFGLTFVLAAGITSAAFGQGQTPAKRRVAVFDFDNAVARGGLNIAGMQTNAPNLGKAVADLLINRLVQDGSVSVIERSAIDKLLSEQNLSNSDRTDPTTAAKLGRILGVDAIILGSITKYDYADKTTGGGGGGFGGFGRGSMNTKHDITALVQVSARIVSPDTAEVMAVSQGLGQVDRKGVKVDIRDNSGAMIMMGMGGANNPTMNEAMDKAIVQLTSVLEQNFAKLPPRSPVIDGLVADASESGRLILNVGSKQGVREGDRLQVLRAGKEIRDPQTGKVLLRDDLALGEALVVSVNEISSIANYKGTEAVKTGDLVKNFPKGK